MDTDSDSSEDSLDLAALTPFKRVVHHDSYKRALEYERQLERYAAAGARLDASVESMKLWVKNAATEYNPAKEMQTFVVTVTPRTPIKELRVRQGVAWVGVLGQCPLRVRVCVAPSKPSSQRSASSHR